MKYLYQQLLAFWFLILVVLTIVGFSFFRFTLHSLEENNYTQLYNYAKSLQTNYMHFSDDQQSFQNPHEALLTALNLTESVLSNQDVNFFLVDTNQNLLYPNLEGKKIKVADNDWQLLMSPDFKGRLAATESTDLFGKPIDTSYIIIPFYTRYHVFSGALIASQPAGNIAKTMLPLKENLIKGFVISSVVALVLSYFLASYQVKRINRLKKATKEISSGNFNVQVTMKQRHEDEIQELANDFNKMAKYLDEYRREVEEQEERRMQFMADASHEMRTPLTTINGLIEGLTYHAIPEDKKENALRLMGNETQRLIRLVNENLDYEKIRTNQISMVIKAFSGKEALTNIATQMKGRAEEKNNQLLLEIPKDVTIYADYDRFVQMFVNIIQNAIQFTENGCITLNLHEVSDGVEIRVSDTGIGMSQEEQKNIWERYFKVDPSRKSTKYGESGLGLPIVQQLVKLHHGKISVTSESGKGTTFTIFLPNKELEEKN